MITNDRSNEKTDGHNCLFPNIRWNEKNDIIIVCFPKLDDMRRMTKYFLFTNGRWNGKTDIIIFCFPILGEMKIMTW